MNANFCPGLLVRNSLKDLKPYNAETIADVIKLDANENPFDFPQEIWQSIHERIGPQTFTRYPDALAQELVQELAGYHGVEPNNIMVGNGSDELILDLMLTFGANNRVVIAVPTFTMYSIHARIAGAGIIEVPRQSNFELPVQEIIDYSSGAGLVMLCSPNNPTGNSITVDQLSILLENCSCPVVVDQAYVEFGGTDFLPLLANCKNLVILRTFSKAYGLAGLRVGYLFAHPELLHYLLKVKQPFNVNTFSQLAAVCVMRHRDIINRQVRQIIEERDILYSALEKIPGVCTYHSDANYLIFQTDYPSEEVYQGLLNEKILVRNFNDPLLSRYLRVSVGKQHENKIFLYTLQKVIKALGEKNYGKR